jgi:hypothetical protein
MPSTMRCISSVSQSALCEFGTLIRTTLRAPAMSASRRWIAS